MDGRGYALLGHLERTSVCPEDQISGGEPQLEGQRSLVATLVCPEYRVDHYGELKVEDHLREHFMCLVRLDMTLGQHRESLQLVASESFESSKGGPLPTMQSTIILPVGARVLGFKFWEAIDDDSGFVRVYHPCVLFEEDGELHLQPLSKHFIRSDYVKFPGRERWLPPELKVLETKRPEEQDIAMIPEALFYVDIGLDISQLLLFERRGLFGYLTLNCFGLLLPVLFTCIDVVRFCRRKSVEHDFLQGLLTAKLVLPLLLVAVLSQCFTLVMALVSAYTQKKHSLLSGAKAAEVAESAISALVQTNLLMSALGGVSQIESLDLSDGELQSLQLSVAVSCFSLGLGFASRDKADSAVLGLPGKLGWGLPMAALVLTRSMEVFSRVFAYNIIQISVRGWPLLRFGGIVAVGLVLLSSQLVFPEEASLADVAASVAAYPGQVLEPSSLLPLWHCLMVHMLLVAAAAGAQLLIRTSFAPEASKVLPDVLLFAWLVFSSVFVRASMVQH
ncbi:unnamed protein product [Symbiodinium sp. CCMP2456]|nr:unnamed protein product [Symbiodinium sp. CCMP2456]